MLDQRDVNVELVERPGDRTVGGPVVTPDREWSAIVGHHRDHRDRDVVANERIFHVRGERGDPTAPWWVGSDESDVHETPLPTRGGVHTPECPYPAPIDQSVGFGSSGFTRRPPGHHGLSPRLVHPKAAATPTTRMSAMNASIQ